MTGSEYQVVVLDKPHFWLPTVSATFHGRDVFGPVAAHLATGIQLAGIGSPTDSLVTIPFPQPEIVRDGAGYIQTVTGEVIHVDRYGNLISNLRSDDLPANPWVTVTNDTIPSISLNYQSASTSRLIALFGSTGLLEVSVPNGNAAAFLGLGVGASISVKAVPRRRLRTAP